MTLLAVGAAEELGVWLLDCSRLASNELASDSAARFSHPGCALPGSPIDYGLEPCRNLGQRTMEAIGLMGVDVKGSFSVWDLIWTLGGGVCGWIWWVALTICPANP